MDDLVYRLTMRAADDDCTAAAERIASLTEAVRVLTEALEKACVFIDSEYRSAEAEALDGHHISRDARPTWDVMTAALTTAKELTK